MEAASQPLRAESPKTTAVALRRRYFELPDEDVHHALLGRASTAEPAGGVLTGVLGHKKIQSPQLIEKPAPITADARQLPLQAWLGTVTEIEGREFVAFLRDQTDPTRPEERAVFANDEVDPEDTELFTVGATFYWLIFEETRRGTRRTVTEIRFRRLPKWSKTELDKLRVAAERRALQLL